MADYKQAGMSTAASTFHPHDSAGVIVASSNPFLRKKIIDTLHSDRWVVQEAAGGADALGKLEDSECDLLLLDQRLPDLDAGELRSMINVQFPGVDVLMLDSDTGRATAPDNLRTSGALRLLETLQPCEEIITAAAITPAVAASRSTADAEPLPGMIGDSEAMRRLYRMVRLVAARSTTVLVTGESGAGKELVAEAVHKLSPRAMRSLVVLNCAAIPEALLESELFGYARGAFTGAVQSRVGRIHAANGGTLFLDEIGEMPLGLQAKLLRFLESGEVQRLGCSDVFRVDARIVAATNANLQRKVAAGGFRKDLYYRLAVFPIELPPLSARKVDVVPLAEHFLSEMAGNTRLSAKAAAILLEHDWPGNVRELKHVIERASILAQDESWILPEHIIISRDEFGPDPD